MNKAIFLDRDGILIKERGDYNYRDEHLEIVEGIAEALFELQKKGYLFIVITNQGGIGKGMYTNKRVKEIHAQLKAFFSSYRVIIKDFFYCPHHPQSSHCICRKPDSLMLEKAMALYNIDAAQSYFVGDNERDKLAGEKAGIKSILIPSNADLREYMTLFE
jgi:D-glycero-D-manno-heptose 1,7-bisphosphate phosphatase